MIKFTKPGISELEHKYVLDALRSGSLSGDGKYTRKVYELFKKRFNIENMLLTTSGTTALEMASILINLGSGDEVIVPSFTFSSTVNAFVLRGAKPVFCDIRTDTMNMDEKLIEALITHKTKAIYVVHYAGVPCAIDEINEIARRHGLFIVEDAAHAVGSTYKGRFAGTLTEIGCYSFHETKNYIMGEGGAIILNEKKYLERAEIIREKGTNRSNVLRGLVDKYTWHDIGSSFLPADILAALLLAQMERFEEIMDKRMQVWNIYHEALELLEKSEKVIRPVIPEYVEHNAHMYNIILPTAEIRSNLIDRLNKVGIASYICYVPLHSSPMGQKFGYAAGMLPVTEEYAERMLRLPLYADMTLEEATFVANEVVKILR